jgi:hypothetical protein
MWERSKTRQNQDYYLWLESRCAQQSYSVIDQDQIFTPCDSCFKAIQVMGQSEDCGSEGSPPVIEGQREDCGSEGSPLVIEGQREDCGSEGSPLVIEEGV